ncbi:MAG: hypothetical protein ACREJ3_08765 [Polyangiaceae bacterium]
MIPEAATTLRASRRSPAILAQAMSAKTRSTLHATVSMAASDAFARSPKDRGLLACRYQGAPPK